MFHPYGDVTSAGYLFMHEILITALFFFNLFSTNKKQNLFVFANKRVFLFYEQTFDTTEPLLPWLEVFFHHLKKIIFVFKILKYKNILQISYAFLLFKLYMATPWNNNHCPG